MDVAHLLVAAPVVVFVVGCILLAYHASNPLVQSLRNGEEPLLMVIGSGVMAIALFALPFHHFILSRPERLSTTVLAFVYMIGGVFALLYTADACRAAIQLASKRSNG